MRTFQVLQSRQELLDSNLQVTFALRQLLAQVHEIAIQNKIQQVRPVVQPRLRQTFPYDLKVGLAGKVNITEGVIRARFRNGVWDPPALMEPGEVYEFTIDLQVTSNVFLRGHRIRLDVTSSNFPLWDRNLNTGNDPATDTEMRAADQTVCHDAARPSHLPVPVIPA